MGLVSPASPGSIPITGGAAILIAAASGLAAVAWIDRTAALFPYLMQPGLAAAVALAAGVGFLDDMRPLRPWQKLAGQLLAAGVAVRMGLTFDLLDVPGVDGALTVVWLVWASNAFNVTDMMDGLAAGVGVIGAVGMACIGSATGDAGLMILGLVTSGSLAGFFVHNAPRARIYMGDAGSLPIGMLLGGMAVLAVDGDAGWMNVATAPLLLGVVMFEALFLCVIRTARGVPVTQASRDHTADRLRLMGLSTRETLVLLLLVQGTCVALALYGKSVDEAAAWAAVAVIAAALAGGALLATVDVRLDAAGVRARGRAWFSRSWLVHLLIWRDLKRTAPHARGRMLDLGCGRQPYRSLFEPQVDGIVAVDRDRLRYARDEAGADAWCDAQALPFGDGAFDTVLSNQMLEHVRRPQKVMDEAARVLRPGGKLILTAPHIWGVHEVPHDYFRFTPFGLRHLAEEAGLVVEEVSAMAGFWVTAGARFSYYAERFGRGVLSLPVRLTHLPLQALALGLDRIHRVESEAWNHLLVARKPGEVNG